MKGKRIEISDEVDIEIAVSLARALAETAGLSHTRQYMVATAVSELATNIHRYAGEGEVTIRIIKEGTRKGIEVVAEDKGPGIPDVEYAMKDGFTTKETSLGLGLPGVKRLMDEFEIETGVNRGTRITARKWG